MNGRHLQSEVYEQVYVQLLTSNGWYDNDDKLHVKLAFAKHGYASLLISTLRIYAQ